MNIWESRGGKVPPAVCARLLQILAVCYLPVVLVLDFVSGRGSDLAGGILVVITFPANYLVIVAFLLSWSGDPSSDGSSALTVYSIAGVVELLLALAVFALVRAIRRRRRRE